ncbi:MAG: sigma-70 family RNA polymerase sigma factor [Bacteroidetes bacterium]|nr:sigma-70 family RNA polymerase sigma factor [Bacteroidota bacterium]
MIEENTEKTLLNRIAGGDGTAFSALVDLYRNKVFSHALAYTKSYHEAEELTQDIFMKVWSNRGKLAEIEDFKNYLFILGRNQLVSAIRKRVMDITEIREPDFVEDLLIPDRQYDRKETMQYIQKGIELLSPQQKAVFTLSRLDHLNYDQISERLGISKSTVKFHMVLALNSLREYLHDAGPSAGILLLLLTVR